MVMTIMMSLNKNGNYYCTKNLKPCYSIIFVFFLFFFKFFYNFDFLITSKTNLPPPLPKHPLSLKKFILSYRICCQNFIQIDNVQKCHFQFFKLFSVILTPKKFSKNLKLRIRYFLETSYNILRGKINQH